MRQFRGIIPSGDSGRRCSGYAFVRTLQHIAEPIHPAALNPAGGLLYDREDIQGRREDGIMADRSNGRSAEAAAGGASAGSWSVVVVAAGRGTRMGTAESKQYLSLLGKPILVHTLELFEAMDEVEEIVLVTGKVDIGRCRELTAAYGLRKTAAVVPGGTERQHSVRLGLAAARGGWVMVHDAVRPLAAPEAVRRCMAQAVRVGAAVLAVPVKDTIKQVGEDGIITSTPDRRSLWAIQTPQAFRRELLAACHEQALRDGFVGTDDAMVVERYGHPVAVAEGDYTNVKITTPDDLPWAEFLLRQRVEDAARD